jgi:hypothetical protein
MYSVHEEYAMGSEWVATFRTHQDAEDFANEVMASAGRSFSIREGEIGGDLRNEDARHAAQKVRDALGEHGDSLSFI